MTELEEANGVTFAVEAAPGRLKRFVHEFHRRCSGCLKRGRSVFVSSFSIVCSTLNATVFIG
jgi:hypothetical protein